MKPGRRASGSPGPTRRSPKGSRGRFGAELKPVDADHCLDSGWIEWGGELIWAVGFTEGGAPYGLRTTDFAAAELEAMGLDPGLAGSPEDEFGRLSHPDAALQPGAFGDPFCWR